MDVDWGQLAAWGGKIADAVGKTRGKGDEQKGWWDVFTSADVLMPMISGGLSTWGQLYQSQEEDKETDRANAFEREKFEWQKYLQEQQLAIQRQGGGGRAKDPHDKKIDEEKLRLGYASLRQGAVDNLIRGFTAARKG